MTSQLPVTRYGRRIAIRLLLARDDVRSYHEDFLFDVRVWWVEESGVDQALGMVNLVGVHLAVRAIF
jgi:hypothetical protein